MQMILENYETSCAGFFLFQSVHFAISSWVLRVENVPKYFAIAKVGLSFVTCFSLI